jgi:hypothetical protein
MNALFDSIGAEYDGSRKIFFRGSLHTAFTLNQVNQ